MYLINGKPLEFGNREQIKLLRPITWENLFPDLETEQMERVANTFCEQGKAIYRYNEFFELFENSRYQEDVILRIRKLLHWDISFCTEMMENAKDKYYDLQRNKPVIKRITS